MKHVHSTLIGIDDEKEGDAQDASQIVAGLVIPPKNNSKAPPKDSFKHEADWDLDISSMCVLLVEDNMMNQKVAIASVASCNVTVHAAGDGKIACDAYEKILSGELPPYDVVF